MIMTMVIALLGRMAPNNTNEYLASSALGSYVAGLSFLLSFFLSFSLSFFYIVSLNLL